jgi:hypothetical protein
VMAGWHTVFVLLTRYIVLFVYIIVT